MGLLGNSTNFTDYKKMQVIFKEGAPSKYLYLLKLGKVLILKKNEKGEDQPIELLEDESILDESSILKDENHKITAIALENCKILLVKKDDLNKTMGILPQWLSFLLATLSSRQDEVVSKLAEFKVMDSSIELLWEKIRTDVKKLLN